METTDTNAKLHHDVRTLWDEMFDITRLADLNPNAPTAYKNRWNRQYEELGATLLSKLRAVKYFRTVGDSYLKFSTSPATGDVVEILNVGGLADGTACCIMLVESAGWVGIFINATPIGHEEYQEAVEIALDAQVPTVFDDELDEELADAPRCRVCGCSDHDCRQCIAKTGEPCYWVSDDLCSACVKEEGGQDNG